MPIYEIRNPEVEFISLVKKGANNKKFFFIKSDDDGGYSMNYALKGVELNEDKHIVRCVAYEPDSVDLQGDFMTKEAIEKYAFDFMKKYRNIDFQHNFEKGFGELIESYVAPVDMVVNGENIRKGSHVIGVEINEEIFKMIENEEITGVSIAGKCERVMVQKSDDTVDNKSLAKMIIDGIKELFVKNDDKNIDTKESKENEDKNDEEIEMEEVKKMLDEVKAEILKSIDEKNEALKKEFVEKTVAMKKEFDEKLTEKNEEKNVIEKSAKEQADEKIAELEKQIEEIRKSVEDPKTSNTQIEKAENKSLFYETV